MFTIRFTFHPGKGKAPVDRFITGTSAHLADLVMQAVVWATGIDDRHVVITEELGYVRVWPLGWVVD